MKSRIIDAFNNSQFSRHKFVKLLESDNYHHIWIDYAGDYENIDNYLSNLDLIYKKHIAIWQIEEDWFEKCNYYKVRDIIKNHINWTDQSYIITNSRQDKLQSKSMGLNTVCRPSILDLLVYQPYDSVTVKNKNITHYTGVCWNRPSLGRYKVFNLFKKYEKKIIVSKIGNKWEHNPEQYNFLFSNLSPETNIDSSGQTLDAPFQLVDSDMHWINRTAFGTVLETRYLSIFGKNRLNTFAPTLSEKTYRNMHFLMPAVICGGQHTRQYLKDLGFDTWDWFVNWEFDAEADDATRFFKFLKELERILSTPLDELVALINSHQDKLQFNRDRLFWLIDNYDAIDI